jgi:hypothetical protein
MRHLRRCLDLDDGHVDAQRIVQRLDGEGRSARNVAVGTATVAVVAVSLLVVLWTAFLASDKVSDLVVTVITPLLLGLVAVAVLLPSLIRLKMPGFEADMQAGLGQVTSGPTGDVVIRPGDLVISTGPTGHMLSRRAVDEAQWR